MGSRQRGVQQWQACTSALPHSLVCWERHTPPTPGIKERMSEKGHL